MEMYAAVLRRDEYDAVTNSSTLFWGALIFIALVASCLFISKLINRPRTKRNTDSLATGGNPKSPSAQAISNPCGGGYGSDLGDFASMIVSNSR